MGSIALPVSGTVYVDANVVIYKVEKPPRYSPVMRPLWTAVAASHARVLVSELILMETLIGPYQSNNPQLAVDYEEFLRLPGIELVPISPLVLREAARLRSQVRKLRSPDAIHGATALSKGVTSLLTNDFGFRNVPGLNVIVLDDIVASSANP
jgi:predicted nucleic acid-binding protein